MNLRRRAPGPAVAPPLRRLVAAVALSAASAGAQPVIGTTPERPAGSPGSPQGVSVLVIDSDFRCVRARLISLDSQLGPTLADDAGRTSRADPAKLIAVIAVDPGADPALGVGGYVPAGRRSSLTSAQLAALLRGRDTAVLSLTDGQRLIGKLAIGPDEGAEGGAEVLPWNSERFGPLSVPLDNVLSMVIEPSAGARLGAKSAAEDRLILNNGDVLRGLLVSIGSTVRIESEGAEQAVPLARVAGLALANPTSAPAAPMLWLSDGTVACVTKIAPDKRELTLGVILAGAGGGPPSLEPVPVALADVRAWSPVPQRITALSAIPVTSFSPLGGRVSADPPRVIVHADDLALPGTAALGVRDVRFAGAMEAEYELPAGSSRFACTAALEDDAGPWGECEVVLISGGREAARVTLTDSEPAAALRAVVGPGKFKVRIEPGRFGPVKNKVRLLRAMVVKSTP